ncbi:glycosyltransferase family 4 protein [Herminiimonas sp. CN]|uniref:glycosyltransferase family 4 protein n=1 Tax=Herminiimonas sp. CN TaxID=1349818 RepID=UPI0004743B5A|nr:glycosyltransferase family 4 protein [Herminiimonas sp. CN]
MRILLTVHQFFPQFTFGTEVLTYSVARELIARGHEVRVLTGYPTDRNLADEERFDEYLFEGIQVYRFYHVYSTAAGQPSKRRLGYDNPLAAAYFKQVLDRFEPDVVHFFHLSLLGTGLIDHAVDACIPAFMTATDFWPICPTAQLVLHNGRPCHGPSPFAGNCVKHLAQLTQEGLVGKIATLLPSSAVDLLVRATQSGLLPPYPHHAEIEAVGARRGINVARLNRLNRILAPNRLMQQMLTDNGVTPHLIMQSAYGINLNESEMDAPRAPPGQPFRLGFIGSLAHHKGCHILIQAFKNLPIHQAVLKIYGNLEDFSEYSDELKRLAADQPGIEFCGTFSNAKIAEVMADLDALVVPSLWYENNPLVIYSAQASRCPVVASDYPGISEAIRHEDNGLLFEAGNISALATQLLRLVNEPGLAARLSANYRQPKSITRYVDELLTLWKTA